jgi:hypothetical protein
MLIRRDYYNLLSIIWLAIGMGVIASYSDNVGTNSADLLVYSRLVSDLLVCSRLVLLSSSYFELKRDLCDLE